MSLIVKAVDTLFNDLSVHIEQMIKLKHNNTHYEWDKTGYVRR
jgi:hypothetical protein